MVDRPPADASDAELLKWARTFLAEYDHDDKSDYLTIDQAAKLAGYSRQTIVNWCRKHGIGEWVPSERRYRVVREKLRAHLMRQGRDRLPARLV
jgi:excisionase family DNA binding protein